MSTPRTEKPADGSRIVLTHSHTILVGQPPDIVKGLLRKGITNFDTLILPDQREQDGSLLNNLEFPLYTFLFVSKGLAEGRRLNLIGDPDALSQALRLLRITLTGPSAEELDNWDTEPELKQEWLGVSQDLALKRADGTMMPVDDFFTLHPFHNDSVTLGKLQIKRHAMNVFEIIEGDQQVFVNLNEDQRIAPPYPVITDYLSGGMSKFSIEVLGGSSGFSTNEPCTGLVMCFNGGYILIDSVPFLNQHLRARGISKNQISAVFLTHLHDDHCSMFPLMEMPHRVEIITTREIYAMAMDKLACGLGWQRDVVEQHFTLIPVRPGDHINYYGLNLHIHNTVHSIPTIGATFSVTHKGKTRDVCLVGDNQNMTKTRDMSKAGIVRASTLANLERLYRQRFHMLIADGGEGDIHGDPHDALNSASDRVVFVHVDEVPEVLKATFSVASSGKRYRFFGNDSAIDTARIHHYLTQWLGRALPNRWLNNLLIEQEIYQYNTDDVIIVEGSSQTNAVYLLLTGYCDIVRIENGQRKVVNQLQAGDVMGEMAALSGTGVRNASVIATTPVMVCVFDEESFANFIRNSDLQQTLEARWQIRPLVKKLPHFARLTSTVIDKIVRHCELIDMQSNESMAVDPDYAYWLTTGELIIESTLRPLDQDSGSNLAELTQFGWQPFKQPDSLQPDQVFAPQAAQLIRIHREDFEHLMHSVPQFNYRVRQRHALENPQHAWRLGVVPCS